MMRTIRGALESVMAAAAVASVFRAIGITRTPRQTGGRRRLEGPDLQ